jgi:hypothetical protein
MEEIEIVKKRLYDKNTSLVVMFKDGEIKEFYGKRVKDIVGILEANADSFDDSVVADKVIGKVAASLLTVGGVKAVYADTISEYAIKVFEENNIKYEFKNKVGFIMNEQKNGMCPMEEKFKDEEDLEIIYNYFINNNYK